MSLLSNKQQDGGAGGKLDRKELKKPDQFTTSMTEFFGEMAKHKRTMLGIVVAIAVVGIGAAWFASQHRAKIEDGKDALFLANQAVEKKAEALVSAATPKEAPAAKDAKKDEAKKPTPPPAAAAENVLFKKLDVDQEFSDGVKLYRDLITKFGSSAPAVEGRMELANLYYRHGQADKAAPLYQEAADLASGSQKAYALAGLGYSLENSGKFQEALQAFEKALKQGEALLKGDMLLSIARTHEALKDSAKAKATYEQVISQLPNTEFSKTAQALKAKL